MNVQMKKTERLGEYKHIDFIGGVIINRIEADPDKKEEVLREVEVLQPKAISDGRIDKNNIGLIKIKSEPDESRFTKEGDIVIKLSTPYDAAYITKDDEGLLVSSFAVILRVNSEFILPEYLVAFLGSSSYLNQVKRLVSGAGVPMLTIGKLKRIRLGEHSRIDQEKIADYYMNICNQKRLMKRINELEMEKIDTIFGGDNNE